jgi:6-phosphofructokinase 2
MSRIITVTFNPCIDKTASVDALEPERKLACKDLLYDPGGGGINVARILHRMGITVNAIYLSGGYNGMYLEKLLKNEGVKTKKIKIEGQTRENLVILDKSKNCQYRFNMPGPHVQKSEWKQCLNSLKSISDISYIVGSGSIPDGVPADIFARLAHIAKLKGARMVVDTSGEPLRYALQEKLYLIKPNLRELAFLSGSPCADVDTVAEQAGKLLHKVKVIVVSDGARGAHLITRRNQLVIHALKVDPISTVGAGDSMVAGILYGLCKRMKLEEAVRFGVASGTATTLRPGTHLCDFQDARRIYKLMQGYNE